MFFEIKQKEFAIEDAEERKFMENHKNEHPINYMKVTKHKRHHHHHKHEHHPIKTPVKIETDDTEYSNFSEPTEYSISDDTYSVTTTEMDTKEDHNIFRIFIMTMIPPAALACLLGVAFVAANNSTL